MQHREEKRNTFIKDLSEFHLTIKFTVEYSEKSTQFLDQTINIENGILKTGLLVKPRDTHQYLESSSYHPYYCKKGIPYRQAVQPNRLSSENFSFDKRCNDLKG